jgi:hypothetical protein
VVNSCHAALDPELIDHAPPESEIHVKEVGEPEVMAEEDVRHGGKNQFPMVVSIVSS